MKDLNLHPMKRAYKEICEGETPWVALGNFMNDFFGYYPHLKQDLIWEPIVEPRTPTQEQHQWAVFCAASVEYLAQKYALACPQWVHEYEPLSAPWDTRPNTPKHARDRRRQETPEAFRRRNIYCGANPYANKYEDDPELLEALTDLETQEFQWSIQDPSSAS